MYVDCLGPAPTILLVWFMPEAIVGIETRFLTYYPGMSSEHEEPEDNSWNIIAGRECHAWQVLK